MAALAACRRVFTPSLGYRLETTLRTVPSDSDSCLAISALDLPSTSCSSTRRSVSVNGMLDSRPGCGSDATGGASRKFHWRRTNVDPQPQTYVGFEPSAMAT